MATFGDTATGAGVDNFGPSHIYTSGPYVAGASGTLSSITARVNGLAGGSGTVNVRAVCYADSAGAPGALVGVSAGHLVVTSGDAMAALTWTMAGQTITSGSSYWLGLWLGPTSVSNVVQIGDDVVVGAMRHLAFTYSDSTGPPDPFGAGASLDIELDCFGTTAVVAASPPTLALLGVGR